MSECRLLLALARMPQLGPARVRRLVEFFGSPDAAWEAPCSDWSLAVGRQIEVSAEQKEKALALVDREGEEAEKRGISFVTYRDAHYPESLHQLNDGPLVLSIKGELVASDQNALAVVGTRNATIYGREMAQLFSHTLAKQGVSIVSGLARGIDTAAHTAALSGGRTIAVLGSGLLSVYPRENSALAEEISQSGALISEYSLFAQPGRQNFPMRNRIVAALSKGTLLVEAPLKSGAMNTATRTKKLGKPLFALPGRADQDNFKGNHQLIKQGEARLVEQPQEVATTFEQLFPFASSQPSSEPQYEGSEALVMQALTQGECGIDQITEVTQLSQSQVNITLMKLLLKKAVKEYPGKIYKKAIAL